MKSLSDRPDFEAIVASATDLVYSAPGCVSIAELQAYLKLSRYNTKKVIQTMLTRGNIVKTIDTLDARRTSYIYNY